MSKFRNFLHVVFLTSFQTIAFIVICYYPKSSQDRENSVLHNLHEKRLLPQIFKFHQIRFMAKTDKFDAFENLCKSFFFSLNQNQLTCRTNAESSSKTTQYPACEKWASAQPWHSTTSSKTHCPRYTEGRNLEIFDFVCPGTAPDAASPWSSKAGCERSKEGIGRNLWVTWSCGRRSGRLPLNGPRHPPFRRRELPAGRKA